MQNESMEDILGSTENTIAKTIRFRLDLPATKIRERESETAQYIHQCSTKYPQPTHETRNDTEGSRLWQDKSSMGRGET